MQGLRRQSCGLDINFLLIAGGGKMTLPVELQFSQGDLTDWHILMGKLGDLECSSCSNMQCRKSTNNISTVP